jgi:DNA topoisomerase-2
MAKYVKLNPIEHVLKRPDVYIGSTRSREVEDYVVQNNDYKIVRKTINVSPAILRIFIEPLSNAIDNLARSKQNGIKTTKICINVNSETGETSFWNDGEVIPIEIHSEEKCYNHTMIFGQLLTSSNYDDDEDRIDISGKNGIGIKATGIFSNIITIEGVDPKNEKKFIQSFSDNLTNPSKPIVTSCKNKNGYTKITYFPDFKQFGLNGYTEDILSIYKRYAVDTAMITKIPIFFNDVEIPVKTLVDYAKLYSSENEIEHISIKTDTCDVVLTTSNNDFETISFANGINTPLGGTHVDAWSEALFRPIVERFNKPKKPQINIGDVKRVFKLFVVATVNKPSFDSQSKLKLESPSVQAEVQEKYIKTIMKWSIIKSLEDIIYMKELAALKKMEKKKGGRPPKDLSDANNAGSKLGRDCILIIVEGESAKTYASHGLDKGVFGKIGRDWLGIYPIRGKPKNTREKSPLDISKNQEINDIIKAIGLQYNVDYTNDINFNKLRYGGVLILADADVDGLHICGLIQNMFHSLFPSLLKRPFLTSMQTPIVRVITNSGNILFYDEKEFAKYEKSQKSKVNCKYYKGLGASEEQDIQETFGRKMITFFEDENTNANMLKAFHKKFTDNRKEWLACYDNKGIIKWLPGNEEENKNISYSDFINTEFIKFSIASCDRAIPNIVDGFKESHRKILHTCFKRKLRFSGKIIKVVQLGGAVGEVSAYHHGEQNLFDTITGMAACFVGCNNIPLLFRSGQFGSRSQGGKDAANARYIWTKLDMLTRLI